MCVCVCVCVQIKEDTPAIFVLLIAESHESITESDKSRNYGVSGEGRIKPSLEAKERVWYSIKRIIETLMNMIFKTIAPDSQERNWLKSIRSVYK